MVWQWLKNSSRVLIPLFLLSHGLPFIRYGMVWYPAVEGFHRFREELSQKSSHTEEKLCQPEGGGGRRNHHD